MQAWVAAGFEEYAKRMPHEAGIELVEIKPEKRGNGKNCGAIAGGGRCPYPGGDTRKMSSRGNG